MELDSRQLPQRCECNLSVCGWVNINMNTTYFIVIKQIVIILEVRYKQVDIQPIRFKKYLGVIPNTVILCIVQTMMLLFSAGFVQ